MQDIRDLMRRHREEATRARAAKASAAEDREAFLKLAGEWDALAEEWTRQHSDGFRAAE